MDFYKRWLVNFLTVVGALTGTILLGFLFLYIVDKNENLVLWIIGIVFAVILAMASKPIRTRD